MPKQAIDHLHPTKLSSQFVHPLNSQCLYYERNEMTDDEKAEAEAKAAEEEAAKKAEEEAKKAEEAKKKNEKGGSAEDRVKGALEKAKEAEERAKAAEAKLKEREDAEKKAAEEKLKEDGKLQEVLDAKEAELANATTEKGTLAEQVKAYEEAAQKQIDETLESIEDEEQRKSVEALLEGETVLGKQKKLPEILKLVGGEAKGGFGGSTPAGSKKVGETGTDQKKARFKELMEKKETLTAQERSEKFKLQTELSEIWNKEQEAKRSET